MPLPDLILNKGEVIVTSSDSTLGITGVDSAINFGIVQYVSDLCDTVTVGASIWFNIKDAVAFMVISGQIFYKLNEQDITGTETAAP